MLDFTDAELRRFAPRMAAFYRDVLLSEEGTAVLRDAGILDNGSRWCHFLGQFGAETGGGTVIRESLTYTSVKRIREVWPARAKKATEAELKKLVRNPVALGDWAYGGRMGNRKGTEDGYAYRGGGWIQTTGKANVAAYCGKLGVAIRPDILDDPLTTLKFACLEWQDSKCNKLADANDLLGVSKAINTGSATSSIYPNGMEHRTAWFDKAKAIWWDAEDIAVAPQKPVGSHPVAQAARSSRTIFGLLTAFGASLVGWFKDAVDQIALFEPVKQIGSGIGLNAATVVFALTIAGLALALFARLDDAHKGRTVK